MLRPQYHLRPSDRGLLAWEVRRLIELAAPLPVKQVPLSAIAEIDADHWYFHGEVPTCRSIVEHCRLIAAADCAYPIILDSQGRVMDGMHRVCRLLMEGARFVWAVQFDIDPQPDFVGLRPDQLPYDAAGRDASTKPSARIPTNPSELEPPTCRALPPCKFPPPKPAPP
jgi:hypothetical protein